MEKNRILWLDIARCLAILSVLLVHSAESGYSLAFEELAGLGIPSACFRVICFTAGRLGVPLFLAISGYLLLDRDFSTSKKIIKFYKSNLFPLLLTVEIWVVLYYFSQVLFNSQTFELRNLIDNMLFMRANEFSHFWYMPMIIGLYIAIPFIARAIKGIEAKALLVPFAAVFIVVFAVNTLNAYYNMFDIETLSPRVDVSFLGGNYGFYLLLGFLCKKGCFKKIKSVPLVIGFLLSCAFCCFTLLFAVKKGYDYHLWYNFIGVLFATVCLFELLSRIEIKGNSKAVRAFAYCASILSQLSLGIYFIHKPVLNVVRTYLYRYITLRPVLTVVGFILTLVISFFIAFVISKIPKVRKWLLLIK